MRWKQSSRYRHKWFAWFPVALEDVPQWVWWEWIYRQKVRDGLRSGVVYFHYPF